MKYQTIISLILLPQLAPALGAIVPSGGDSLDGLQKRNIEDSVTNKIDHVGNEKANAPKVADKGVKVAGKGLRVAGNGIKIGGSHGVKVAGKGAKAVGNGFQKVDGELQKTFALDSGLEETWDDMHDVLPTCAKSDCNNSFFMNEALGWVKSALEDVGVSVHEHPAATAALVIGVSFLLIELISGGVLIPIALRAIGFGSRGPIKNTIAAAVQRVIHPVQLGSVFSRFQSAAMNGAGLKELQSFVNIIITALVGAGIAGLIEAGINPHEHSDRRQEWRKWVSESMVNPSYDSIGNAAQFWGAYTSQGCMAYGYHEVQAPFAASIPEDTDPLTACKQTPALLYDMGFKTPLNCIDEGPKKGIIGMWYVPTNATQCMPTWNKFEDEGCVLYGRRRRFSRLMGLKINGDWTGVCETTAATIDDKHYEHPSHCDDKGFWGIYGVFDIEDEQCECSCVPT